MNILDYLKRYGKYSFEEKPLNHVDSLILCQFSYFKFDGMVPEPDENRKSVTLKDLREHPDFEHLFVDNSSKKDNMELFELLSSCVRYRNMKMNCYTSITDTKWQTQFAAITFILEDHTMYVAYRGTDETLVGWKEDFNMAFESPVPGQSYALRYLNVVTGHLRNRFYIGGHSKGGNLAMYAAMKCAPSVRERLIRIYSMDGPGFPADVLKNCQFENIRDRVVKILPRSSLVGMLFGDSVEYKVTKSKAIGGIMQHNPYTWVVKDHDFVYEDAILESAKVKDQAVNEWLYSSSEEQRRLFIDTVYNCVAASEAGDVLQMKNDWKNSISRVMKAMKDLDPETRKAVLEIFKKLFEIAMVQMKNEAGEQFRTFSHNVMAEAERRLKKHE